MTRTIHGALGGRFTLGVKAETPPTMLFQNRFHAGRVLARKLKGRSERMLVLGWGGGGALVGYEIARALGARLEVCAGRPHGVAEEPWGDLDLAGRVALLVDDGLAPLAEVRAAACALRRLGAARVLFAAPVAAFSAGRELGGEVAEVIAVCRRAEDDWPGWWYRDFHAVSERELLRLLQGRASVRGAGAAAVGRSPLPKT